MQKQLRAGCRKPHMLEMAGSCQQHSEVDHRADLERVLEEKEVGCRAYIHKGGFADRNTSMLILMISSFDELGSCRASHVFLDG